MGDRDRDFSEYVDTRALMLRRTAYLMCGDWHRAEDLVQTTLAKLYVKWPRIVRDGRVDAYVRKALLRTCIDDARRPHRKRETTVDLVPDDRAETIGSDQRVDVLTALDKLPSGQRAVVVLRFWEDQSVIETARLLGVSEGTVKSQTSKGLGHLRGLFGAHENVLEEHR